MTPPHKYMDPKTAIENLEEDYLDAHPEEKEKEATYAPISSALQELRSASKPNQIAIDLLLKKPSNFLFCLIYEYSFI